MERGHGRYQRRQRHHPHHQLKRRSAHRVVDLVRRQRQDVADALDQYPARHNSDLLRGAPQCDRQAIDDDTIVQTATPIRRENTRDDDVVRLPGSRVRRGDILDRKLDRGHLRPSTNELGDEFADHQIEVLTPRPPRRSPREKQGTARTATVAVTTRDMAARRKHPLRVGVRRAEAGDTGTECRTLRGVIAQRHCSKPGCSTVAVATLTYDYRDSTVVVGPLATVADPNSYDLCEEHAHNLTAPLGWQVVRLATTFEPAPPSGDDLAALVDAVRRVAQEAQAAPAPPQDTRKPTTGPFGPARSVGTPDTSSPLDPSSPYARRRAQFTVVDGTDTEDTTRA